MTRPGARGTWNRDLHFALHAAGRRRHGLTPPYRSRGYLVLAADHRAPWGRSTHASGYLSHAVSLVVVAWRGGRVAGGLARWRCGAATRHFRLEMEPSGPICPLCTIDRTTTRRP